MINPLNPYVPNLAPGVRIPHLPEVTRARLYELVTELVNSEDRRRDRISAEVAAAHDLAGRARLGERGYVALLASRTQEKDRLQTMDYQAAVRCKYVADVLILRQMYLNRKKLAKAVGAELIRLKAKAADFPDEHPLVTLLVSLTALVNQFSRVRPDDALQYLNCVAELPSHFAMETVQAVFEEINLVPGANGDYLATSNIEIPFIERGEACGGELLLLWAVRDVKKAQKACREIGPFGADYLGWDQAEYARQLEKALRNKDQKRFDQVKQDFADSQASFFARAADLKDRLAELKKTRMRLGEALIDSKHATLVDYTLSTGSPEGIATLTAAINCISAYRLWLDVGNDKRLYEEKLQGVGKAPVSLKNYIDTVLSQVVASPAVS